MRRGTMHCCLLVLAVLVLVPVALTAATPVEEPTEAPAVAVECPPPAPDRPAVTPVEDVGEVDGLAARLFTPEATPTSGHCCPPGQDEVCADLCAPDDGFAACVNNTCFCVCVTIN